jgi:paraquat-inducible protein B
VEFKGIKIGSVVDVRLEYDAKSAGFRIPVTIEVEPERVLERGEAMKKAPRDAFQVLVKRGLRARLATGNLLTGQLYVDLDMHPNTPLKLASMSGGKGSGGGAGGDPELPTVPANLEQMTVTVKGILERLERVDFEAIGRELQSTLKGANALANSPQLQSSLNDLAASLASAKTLLAKVDARAEPLTANLDQTLTAAREALDKAKATMSVVDTAISPDAPLHEGAGRLAHELSEAARALRSLVDMLERNPQSLLFGKKAPAGN